MMFALLVLLAAISTFASSPAISASIARPSKSDAPEPFWGRIYLRHGAVPIQYFRDSFGGATLAHEAEFRFPFDQTDNRFGCNPLRADERFNGSVVLVVDRGECSFEQKARVAEAAGAGALVIVNDDESVTRPTARVDVGEIQIPSVMVRRSAGELLRATVLGANERVFGRLLPMQCSRSRPSTCSPRTESERAYIENALARSGLLVATSDGSVVGEFLASKFGGLLPQRAALPVSTLLHASVVCREDPSADAMLRVDGTVALIDASGSEPLGCSVVDMVARVQSAGAAAALIATDSSASVSTHPSVAEDWQAYNVTIFSGVVAMATVHRLVELETHSPTLRRVHFTVRNEIADAWAAIHELALKSAWPVRKDRKETLVRQLLDAFTLNADQMEVLKRHFLTVAGGSGVTWELLAQTQSQTSDAVGSGGGEQGEATTLHVSVTGPLTDTAGKSHMEL